MTGVITRHAHGPVVELRLDRKPANALSRAACDEWAAALRDAVRGGAEAVVLSGTTGVFSGGADLNELARADREAFGIFSRALVGLAAEVVHCPVPIAAALTGHCLGGAAGIALQCDARFMATGHFRFRINYVAMGLVPPMYVSGAVERLVGAGRAHRLLVGAQAITPEEACALGIVERVVAPGEVVAAAVEWCTQLLALPRGAMLEARKLQRAELAAGVTPEQLEADDATERWFGPEVQALLAKAAARASHAPRSGT